MSDAQRVDALKAMALLAPRGASLTLAAQVFNERAVLLKRTVLFSVLREEMVVRKRKDSKSARHVNDLRSRLTSFGKKFDTRAVATIETREIDDWLSGLELSLTSRFNYRKVLRNAFQFAISRGYAAENPVVKTEKIRKNDLAPGILTPTEISALLASADPRIVSSIALSAFAGLRDAEAGRLTWDKVDIEGGYIKIDASIAKTASRRLVPVVCSLRAWIMPHAQKAGLVRPAHRLTTFLLAEAKRGAISLLAERGDPSPNLQLWPHNALRHSFVSYRMAIVANAAQVAEECGHSVQVMKKNYRELVTEREAKNWFSVMPQ